MRIIRTLIPLAVILAGAEAAESQTVKGCIDRAANNFNANANVNDGSCTYNAVTLTPTVKFNQTASLAENSGLVYWNNRLWQHNDGGGAPAIYSIDTSSKTILRTVTVSGATNIDWEDIAQDENHIYIGDFGNNANGARTDLKIYKIAKSAISSSNGDTSVNAEVITFRYPDQPQSPTPVSANTTDFDCEAMVVHADKIYLFTKQWTGLQTTLYELPSSKGTYTATKLASLDVNGLITGADILPSRRVIVLTGYSKSLQRFAYLLYDYSGNDFFGANKRRLEVAGFAQTESVAFLNPDRLAMGSEQVSVLPATLETMDLTSLLKDYYTLVSAGPSIGLRPLPGDIRVSHRGDMLYIVLKQVPGTHAEVFRSDGRRLRSFDLPQSTNEIAMRGLSAGIYTLRVWQGRFPQVLRFSVL